jgi:hypothetical protein
LTLLAHLTFIFALGTNETIVSRPIGAVPHLQVAESSDELITLNDPTLFVLPHAKDFAASVWLSQPTVPVPEFAYVAPPEFLPLPIEDLGASFATFAATNQFSEFQFDFKPEPPLTYSSLAFKSPLPKQSTLQMAGGLAGRRLLSLISVPTLPINDVLAPSRVQALVAASGEVISTVLFESSGNDIADQTALKLVLGLRFTSASRVTTGELIFHWHTVPVAAP